MWLYLRIEPVVISSRANTGPAYRQTPVLFEPAKLVQLLPEGLEVNETSLNIKPGKCSCVQVAVYNGADHGITLKRRTSLGVLQEVKSVTAADVSLSECSIRTGQQHLREHEPQGRTRPTPSGQQGGESKNHLPAVEFSGLNQDQRIIAETMLREEYESFSSSEEGIGCIPDLEMEINLKDSQPVQKKYTSIP